MEEKTMSRSKTVIMLTGLYLAFASAYTGNIITPVTSHMLADFADYPEPLVNFLISGAALFSLVTSLLVGIFAKYVSKRRLQIICTAIYSIGGLGMIFATELPLFIACRMCCGIGSGCAMVTVPGIICEIYPEGKERTRYISFMTTAGLIFGMVFSLLSGIIADNTSNWHNVFWLELIAVLAFFGAVFFVPNTPPEGKANAEKAAASGGKIQDKKLNVPFFIILFAGQFLMQGLYCVMYYLSDVYVSQTAIGGSTLTGLSLSIGAAAGALFSVMSSSVITKCRRWTAPLAWAAVSLCFAALGLRPGAVLFVAAAAISCGFQTFAYVYYQVKFTEIAPQSKMSIFMAIFTWAGTLSVFLSPYVPGWFKSLFGAQNMQECFLWLGIIMMAIAVTSVILIFVIRDSHDKPSSTPEEAKV